MMSPSSDNNKNIGSAQHSPTHSNYQPSEESHLRTLWIGDLDGYMDETFVYSLFAHTNEVAQIKVIRDKGTGLGSGYGFVEFNNNEIAKYVLETHNGKPLPIGNGKMYRLNWAAHGINERKAEIFTEYSVFVGDLSPEVTDYLLLQTFVEKYQSVRSAKVVVDVNTGLSKRYGFVRFGNEEEMNRALSEMQGQYCGSRPIRLNHAIPRKQEGTTSSSSSSSSPPSPPRATSPTNEPKQPIQIPEGDPYNTTVFIGGLDPTVTEDDLRFHFSPYGELVYIKIPIGKACGFVQFTNRLSAEAAFEKHGSIIGRQRVRLSWGRSSKGSSFTSPQTADNSGANHTITTSQTLSPFPSLFNSPHLNLRAQSYYQDIEDDESDNNIDFDIPLSLSSVESIQPFSRLSNYLNTESDDEEQIELDSNQFQPQRRDQLFLSSLSENSLTLACNLGLPFPILPSQPKNVR